MPASLGSSLAITAYFLKHDPQLVERRMNVGPGAESERSQKRILVIAGILACALVVVPGLDVRFHWSDVPVLIVLLANALVVLGFLIVIFVYRANTYAAGVVTVEANQRVISTGPYRYVRHPSMRPPH